MSDKQPNIIQAVKDDHTEVQHLYDQYRNSAAAGNVNAQQRWARQLTWEIACHSVGEEIVLYPLIEEKLGGEGKRMTDRDRTDHQVIKEKLAALEKMRVGTEEYGRTLAEAMGELKEHIASEESVDLPKLEVKLDAEGSKKAGESFERTKMFAPTRAHPHAPDKPPYETLVGFMSMPIDKLKDVFSKFPTEEMKEGTTKV
ncbi:hypothetical protein AX16_007493 [Volvariella volvacea WC 439]|nr:hypothetical protein AX16_007493 [Volvariella volvacea WC 439]